ncbi:hypothetical protein [uncultured Microbacterium sp.]|nr:hypothetical protein [uncultured Microbacterium sp.]
MSDASGQATNPDPDEGTELDEAEKIDLQRQLAFEVEQFEGGIEG